MKYQNKEISTVDGEIIVVDSQEYKNQGFEEIIKKYSVLCK